MDKSRIKHEVNIICNEGIIVEIDESYIMVMSKYGEIIKIKPRQNNVIGETIYFFEDDLYVPVIPFVKELHRTSLWLCSSVAAVILIIILVTMQVPATYALLSLDINPSINMEIDNHGNVKKLISLNKEAEILIDSVTYRKKSFEDVVDTIIQKAEVAGYLFEEDAFLIGIAPTRSIPDDLMDRFTKLKVSYNNHSFQSKIMIGNINDGTQSLESNVSIGRLLLYKEHPELNPSDCNQMNIRQIFNLLQHESKDDNKDDKDEDASSNDSNIWNGTNEICENNLNKKDEMNDNDKVVDVDDTTDDIEDNVNGVKPQEDDTQEDDTQEDDTQEDDTQEDDTQEDDTQEDDTQEDDTQEDDTQEDDTQEDDTQEDDTQKDDTQEDDTQEDDTQEDDTQENDTQEDCDD